MFVALIHRRIKPDDANKEAFLEHWKMNNSIGDRTGLIAEFVSDMLPMASLPYITWHLDSESFQERTCTIPTAGACRHRLSLVTGTGDYKGCPPGGYDRAANPFNYWAPTIIILSIGVLLITNFSGRDSFGVPGNSRLRLSGAQPQI